MCVGHAPTSFLFAVDTNIIQTHRIRSALTLKLYASSPYPKPHLPVFIQSDKTEQKFDTVLYLCEIIGAFVWSLEYGAL